ncbi:MAG: DUF4268 domain-containing protein [Methanobacterium sp.]
MDEEIKFGDITELPLNKFFKREDLNFTPWLSENIRKLGDKIGVDIEGVETEFKIGSYYLDILAYESGTDRKIAIENQFAFTDHDHLGKLLTYMAGVDAEVVVWIAENFRDEHITALNHLNQISNKNIAFFAVRPRIIKIGNSEPAIEFVIIAQPDEWEKSVKTEGFTDRENRYYNFWTMLIDEYSKINSELRIKPTKFNAIGFNIGKSGFSYNWRFSREKWFTITLWIDVGDKTRNHEIYDKIYSHKDNIFNQLGENISFFKKEDTRLVAFNLINDIKLDIMELNENDKKKLIKWAIKWTPKFLETFEPIIQKID